MKKSEFNTKRYLPLILAIFIALIFAFSSSAHALQIKLTQGADEMVIIDQEMTSSPSKGADTYGGTVGSVSWNGVLGVFNINVVTGTSYPVRGSVSDPRMSLLSIETTSSQAGTLTVELTDQNFIGPLNSSGGGFHTMINGVLIGKSVVFNAYYDDVTNAPPYDDVNGPYASATNIADGSWTGSGMTSWGDTYTRNLPANSPFSLTMKVDITHTGVGQQTTQFDATVETVPGVPPIPEPGTILLLGLGLLGIGIIGKKKR